MMELFSISYEMLTDYAFQVLAIGIKLLAVKTFGM